MNHDYIWTAESLAAELEVTVDELYDMIATGPLNFLNESIK